MQDLVQDQVRTHAATDRTSLASGRRFAYAFHQSGLRAVLAGDDLGSQRHLHRTDHDG